MRAFSGATGERVGCFEAADGGTLLLDEVGELSLPVQAKLPRVLQEGEVQRLGEDVPRRVDVRIIAATNRQLAEAVREGSFRADLYHRLSAYPVVIPPLRERSSDILVLAYAWPGNVCELEHVISRAAIKALSRGARRDEIITLAPAWLDLPTPEGRSDSAADVADNAAAIAAASLRECVERALRGAIREALAACDGRWAAAARRLELDPSNLHKLARRLGLK